MPRRVGDADPWPVFHRSYPYTWSTQTDSIGYARRDAERRAADVRAIGLEVDIHTEHEGGGETGKVTAFALYVSTDKLGVEALRFKRFQTDLVEFVRLCWAQADNPRVHLPFLPHGFEEQHGITFQGRLTKSRPCKALMVIR